MVIYAAVILGKKLDKNSKLSSEGKQRVEALFELLFEKDKIKYVVFSGGIVGDENDISEAEAMEKYFLSFCENRKKVLERSSNLENIEYRERVISKLNQLLQGKEIQVILEKDSTSTQLNAINLNNIFNKLKSENNNENITPIFVTHHAHIPRLDTHLNKIFNHNYEIRDVERILEIEKIQPKFREYVFRFLAKIGLDDEKYKTYWNKIKEK